MAFYEVFRDDETGYATALVRAHGLRQAVAAVSHLGFTANNSVAVRVPDGRTEPNKVLAFAEERSANSAPVE
jgi:hypothetical protein